MSALHTKNAQMRVGCKIARGPKTLKHVASRVVVLCRLSGIAVLRAMRVRVYGVPSHDPYILK